MSKVLDMFRRIYRYIRYYKKRYYEKMLEDERHYIVAQQLISKAILDVGGTKRANLGLYIPYRVITINKNKACKPNIVADTCHLPIKTKSCDIMTAIQVFHQIPRPQREQMVNELRRVAQKKIILHDYASGSSFQDLKKIMPNAQRWKLRSPYMLIVESMNEIHRKDFHIDCFNKRKREI